MRTASGSSSYLVPVTVVIAGILIAASLMFVGFTTKTEIVTTTKTVTTNTTVCTTTLPGQPLGASIRILNGSTLGPIAGAVITATSPVAGVCGSSSEPLSTIQFTTNATEWYSLPVINRGTYQIVVDYAGRSYGLAMPLDLSVYNCGTIYIPSGSVNVTTTGASQETCQSAIVAPTKMTTNQTSTNSAINLALRLELSTATSASGFSVSVNASDFNVLSSTNRIASADTWFVPLNGSNVSPCWVQGWPVGFAIARGHYTSSNITAARFLELVNPNATYNCPDYGPFSNAAAYDFAPLSDMATGYDCGANSCFGFAVSAARTPSHWGPVTGSWARDGTYTSLSPGAYTVLAEDEWGNYALAYFQVTS